MKKRSKLIFFSLLLIIGFMGLYVYFNPSQQVLILKDQDTRTIYGQWVMEDGDLFSLSFIHSVNKSLVKDELMVKDGLLLAHKTTYSGFGAGVQTELNEGEILTYDEDHQMVITNMKTTYKDLNLIVGTVSDHILEIHDKEISLTKLCGKNTAVTFAVAKGRGNEENYER